MAIRLRLLLDTNVLIPLEDSLVVLGPSLANVMRLVGLGGHTLVFHPDSEGDIREDRDPLRRERTLHRLGRYTRLEHSGVSPLNTPTTSRNDAADNNILYALQCDAVHALISEDREIHAKARRLGLGSRVYTIQTAEDWLKRLHEPAEVHLPNIEDVALHTLTQQLSDSFFRDLKESYTEFEEWFREKAREGRHGWIYRAEADGIAALCVYTIQEDARVTDDGTTLSGRALKLCTFKVGELVRGRKVGELFLKAAFRFASENACEHIFIHGDANKHAYLMQLLEDFGFSSAGQYRGDAVMVKQHPRRPPPPDIAPTDYCRRYYPHFRDDAEIDKYIVPIRPNYHEILFPDYVSRSARQMDLFRRNNNVGNAIKLAYLCHSPIRSVKAGDILLFYRTVDERAITTVGVVDHFELSNDAAAIAEIVSRRTVYSDEDIERLAQRETKVILFRLIKHVETPISSATMGKAVALRGPIQTVRRIEDSAYQALRRIGGW